MGIHRIKKLTKNSENCIKKKFIVDPLYLYVKLIKNSEKYIKSVKDSEIY